MSDAKERPILFTSAMVRAVLDGRKTQTRRVIKPQPIQPDPASLWYPDAYNHSEYWCFWGKKGSSVSNKCALPQFKCPYGKIGDKLWVREAHAIVPASAYAHSTDDGENQLPHQFSPDEFEWAVYREGWTRSAPPWRPSIHMPRWASRILLEVTNIRVERLQDISQADAIAEGARYIENGSGFGWSMEDPHPDHSALCLGTARAAFGNFINKLHGGINWNLKPDILWDKNPWVWVVEFKVLEVKN